MYDFNLCKLCQHNEAAPAYRLRNTTIYICGSCRFHFIDHLDTMPAAEGAGSGLDDRSWQFIEAHIPENTRRHRANLGLVTRHCRLPGTRCLDIGAGAGVFPYLVSDAGAESHGIEPQGAFREYAERKFGMKLRGETVESPAWQEAYAGFFDLVTLWDVLEHLNFPAETLFDACRLLKPEGWLFLDTPCRDSLFYKLSEWSYRLSGGKNTALLETLYSPRPFRHKQMFTQRQLTGLVERAGLSVVQVKRSVLSLQNRIVLVGRKPSH